MAGILRVSLIVFGLCAVLVAGVRVELGRERPACETECCCAPEAASCCSTYDGPVLKGACGCGHDSAHICLHLGPLAPVVPLSVADADGGAGRWTTRIRELGRGTHPAPEPPPPRRGA